MTEVMDTIFSKILVYEEDEKHAQALKAMFQESNLTAFKPVKVLEALTSSVDFGGVFLCQPKESGNQEYMEMLQKIREMNSEIPIFFRINDQDFLENEGKQIAEFCTVIYHKNDITKLKDGIERYLFSHEYPNAFIRGVREFTESSLSSCTQGVNISCSLPYLVKDNMSNGGLISVIYLESTWCRGYMMLQADNVELMRLIKEKKTYQLPENLSAKDLNSLLSEFTNMIWGEFRNKFIPEDEADVDTVHKIEIPIVINYAERYASFGSGVNQLCFQYTLDDVDKKMAPISIYQKFVFNLTWSPEKFREPSEEINDLLEQGSIEEW